MGNNPQHRDLKSYCMITVKAADRHNGDAETSQRNFFLLQCSVDSFSVLRLPLVLMYPNDFRCVMLVKCSSGVRSMCNSCGMSTHVWVSVIKTPSLFWLSGV